jgi:hypothetical protein
MGRTKGKRPLSVVKEIVYGMSLGLFAGYLSKMHHWSNQHRMLDQGRVTVVVSGSQGLMLPVYRPVPCFIAASESITMHIFKLFPRRFSLAPYCCCNLVLSLEACFVSSSTSSIALLSDNGGFYHLSQTFSPKSLLGKHRIPGWLSLMSNSAVISGVYRGACL